MICDADNDEDSSCFWVTSLFESLSYDTLGNRTHLLVELKKNNNNLTHSDICLCNSTRCRPRKLISVNMRTY